MTSQPMPTPPWRKWFKLVGVSGAGGQVPDLWAVDEPGLFDLMRFPKHRRPDQITNHNGLIAYPVGKRKVFAAQRRRGAISINPPMGPKGSVTERWPHTMEVEIFAWVPDLRRAPDLSVDFPEFMAKYKTNFWNGSHWQITDDEFENLEAAIIAAGQGVPVPPPPFGK